VRYCHEEGWIETLPKNLGSRRLTFKVAAKTVETIAPEDLKKILGTDDDRVKLWVLLALNCGMSQADIAELRHDEVDWQEGRIRRKRTKTKDVESVPEVDYRLWPETFRLLQALRSTHPDLVFANRDGKPLIVPKVAKNGGITRYNRKLWMGD